MAKLIDPAAQERPVVRQLGGTAQMRQPVLGSPARGMAQAGANLVEGGDELYRAQKVEEDRINTLRAEDAFTKLRERQLDLSVGEETGFSRLKGAEAVTRPVRQEWGKRFEDAETEIAGTLSNDTQRQKFKQRAGVSRLQFEEEMLRHLAKEGDSYAKEVYDGTLATEQRNAVARWDSPNDIGSSIERIRAAVDERAERYGWANEYRDATLRLEQGKVHAAVVQQALATGNYKYAQSWYEEHREDIDLGTAKQLAKAVEDGAQKEKQAFYNADYLANEDNRGALENLRKRVLEDSELGADRQNILVGRIQNRQAVLDHRARAAEDKRLRRIERGLADLNASTLAGFEPTAEQFSTVMESAKGTELEPEVRQAIKLAGATRAFRNAPPLQQEQLLAEAERGVRTEPTKFDRNVVGAWRTIYDAQRRQVKESPVTFMVQQGFVDPPMPLDLANPAGAGEALAEQLSIARDASVRYQVPIKPLTTEQVGLLRAVLQGASVDQKRNYFAGLVQGTAGDTQGYMAIMAQLAPDEPVTAIAGSLAARGRTAESDLMLRGQAILAPSKKADGKPDGGSLYPMPPETDMRMSFDNYVREAFSGKAESRSAHYQAAKAIYAALSVDEGDRDTKVLQGDRWERAMTLAIGPIEKYQGRRIVMPAGYEYSQFRDGLRQRIDQVVEAKQIDPSWTTDRLRDLPLENVGDGRYVLRAGDGYVVEKTGKPVLIDFNVSLPFRPSGHGLTPLPSEPAPSTKGLTLKGISGKKTKNDNRGSTVAPGFAGVRG